MSHDPDIGDGRRMVVTIPSRGRYDCRVVTQMFADPVLCPPEDEVPLYRAANPGVRLHPYPAGMYGLGRIKQWMLDTMDEEVQFQIDDDVDGFYCSVGQSYRRIKAREDIWQVLANQAHIAAGIPTALWGFAHTVDTRHMRAFKPFSLIGYVNGFNMGIMRCDLDRWGLRFDPQLVTKCDIDFSLQVLLKCRVLWRDNRFAFKNDQWMRRPGGNATFRTREVIEQCIKILKDRWGDAVDVDHFENKGKGKHQNVHLRVER